jgi:cell division protein FtsX
MVGLALFVVGLFSLATFNMEEALEQVESRVEVVAYLRDDVRTSEIELARQELARAAQVRTSATSARRARSRTRAATSRTSRMCSPT